MRTGKAWVVGLAIVTAAAAAACAQPAATTADGQPASADPSNGDQNVTSVIAVVPPGAAITDPAALRKLETMGFAFGHHFGVAEDAAADVLSTSSQYQTITQGIETNLDTLQANDPTLRVGIGATHRLFDRAWLHSSLSHFVLVAVTNRVDRASGGVTCGETRFVYRLEYASPRQGGQTSRMPMTVAIVTPQTPREGESSCGSAMKRWLNATGTGDSLATNAAAGPLAQLAPFATIETNIQAVRWPSAARKDMGGEAEYMLNVWRPTAADATQMEMAPLDNTPDIDAITGDPAKRAALVSWVKANVSGIDHGIAHLPADLSAHTAYSYGPRGFARLANRPFSQLVQENDLAGVSYDGLTHVKSAFGLARKLDEQSCEGCHQLRAVAGFHVLGDEDDQSNSDPLNRLAVGTSPHFNEELTWRMRLVNAVSGGADPAVLDEARPFAEHATNDGLAGASCGLGDDPTFAGWTCESGLVCVDMIGQGKVGACMTKGSPKAGEACQKDLLNTFADPNDDTVTNLDDGNAACASGTPNATCAGSVTGFPNGVCSATCPLLGMVNGRVICGTEPKLGFNECMAIITNTFDDCMGPPQRLLRQACTASLPCRDDYVCSYVPGATAGVGACMPPYFVFQARLDGHD